MRTRPDSVYHSFFQRLKPALVGFSLYITMTIKYSFYSKIQPYLISIIIKKILLNFQGRGYTICNFVVSL
jgi:hypothetical protein